jgi:hypothetical protein
MRFSILTASMPLATCESYEELLDILIHIHSFDLLNWEQLRRNRPRMDGDFNCDGKQDYAVLGVNGTDPLAKTLLSAQTPSMEALKTVRDRYYSLSFNSPAVVWVGLSDTNGFAWRTYLGSYVSISKSLEGDLFERAQVQVALRSNGGINSPEIDAKWAHEHRCEILSIGCCEKPGMDYIWDQRNKQLIAIYLGEC